MTNLFTPIKVGPYELSHRVVLAPMTRMRADAGDKPNALMQEYYEQRASKGGLLVSEAVAVSLSGRAYLGAAGIYTDEQMEAWKPITAAVHAKGAKIFMQLWHGGRQSHTDNEPGNRIPVAPSAVAVRPGASLVHTVEKGWVEPTPPRALELEEIASIIEEFRVAAERAKQAGFDGVEVHAANGYLPDQFLQDGSNQRTDAYGGSVENRSRFLLELTEALVSVWGDGRVAVRISPSTTFGDMFDSNPRAIFGYLAEQLNNYPLAYLHVIEPRVAGDDTVKEAADEPVASVHLRPIYKGLLIAAGGFNAETADAFLAAGTADFVSFGRQFVANPDLPERIRNKLPLNPYIRDSFYLGDHTGYTDYPFYKDSPLAKAA